ncbi:MAG: META domain-containing protein [Acidimicrobiia bacterium]|nr:META domain-containing protein [Acidimicrobiia bacterium]
MLIALMLLVTSACTAAEVDLPKLIGDWELLRGTVEGDAFPVVDGHRITMNFSDDGTVGGVAACNSYGSTYVADDEDLIIGRELASTAMGCEPRVMDSEAAFLAVLRESLTYTVSGDELTIIHSGGELVFSRVQPVQAADLLDTRWRLETLIRGGTASSVRGEATLRLGSDGNVAGSTGCRTFSGEHVIDADTVLFSTFSMAGECPAELADQDGLIVNVLGDGFTTAIDGDGLTLTSRGEEALVYRRDG